MTVCPLCGGNHSLSKCPRWRPPDCRTCLSYREDPPPRCTLELRCTSGDRYVRTADVHLWKKEA